VKFKSLLALLLAFCMIVSLSACGSKKVTSTDSKTDSAAESIDETASEDETVSEDETSGEANENSDSKASGNAASGTSGAVSSQKSSKPGSGSKLDPNDTGTSDRPKETGYVGRSVTIKSGTKPMNDGLNFGGASFRFLGYDSDLHRTMIAEFQKKHNAKIDMVFSGTGVYTQQVAAAKAAGTPYDIIFISNPEYPQIITADCVTPLQDYITTADLWTKDKWQTHGGLSRSVAEGLAWNNNMYAAGGGYSSATEVFIYNKKMLTEAGLTDPYKLYTENKWTWQTVLDYGAIMSDSSKNFYFSDSLLRGFPYGITLSYGADFVKFDDEGFIKENLSDPKIYNALTMLQKLSSGKNPVLSPTDNGVQALLDGKVASIFMASSVWQSVFNGAKDSNAFDKKTSNIGMVPVPLGADNTEKLRPIRQWQAYAAGAGTKDPRAAIAFAKIDSIYNHRNIYQDSTPPEYKKMLTDIMDTDGKLISPMWGFSNSAGSLQSLGSEISGQVVGGANVSNVLTAFKKKANSIIETATK